MVCLRRPGTLVLPGSEEPGKGIRTCDAHMVMTDTILPAPLATVNDRARTLAAVVCAGSAGVHAVLVPDHLHESTLLGFAFALDALLLGLASVLLGSAGRADRTLPAAAGLLTATALTYVLSRTTGMPVLVPEVEPLDGLGACTTLSELAGALACLLPILRREPR
jgi:hypothetical protein